MQGKRLLYQILVIGFLFFHDWNNFSEDVGQKLLTILIKY